MSGDGLTSQYRRSKLVKLWINSHKLGSQGISRNKQRCFCSFFYQLNLNNVPTISMKIATLLQNVSFILFVSIFVLRESECEKDYCSFHPHTHNLPKWPKNKELIASWPMRLGPLKHAHLMNIIPCCLKDYSHRNSTYS